MNLRYLLSVGLLLLACGGAETEPAQVEPEFFEIPDHDVVLRWRLEDYGNPDSSWDYRVSAEGRFTVMHNERYRGYYMRACGSLRGGLSASIVDTLLEELAVLGAFDIDEQATWEEVLDRPDEGVYGPHAGPTTVWVRFAGRANKFEFRTISFWAEHLPEAALVQQAAAVDARIEEFLDDYCRPWQPKIPR